MGQDYLATKMANTLVTMLILSGPPLAAAVVLGVVVGFLQAVTQIQDQTLPQAVKLVVVVVLVITLGPAFSALLLAETSTILDEFPFVVP
ncbi:MULTISPECIES: flagellar biosynthetic protein FliQ [Chelatococcus]|uniref:Type III secretion protein S n=1 Tax=Chelatococcus caeni TaxID=1348468 RepID=A0A840BZL3_9HYPH|nr:MULTISPECIES: flagellar biosynthetic protein FliQ [unclassified Chelatococcus]ALA17089.1 type III secretion protein [Chelatococcus sp. CO-6]MBB4017162.1 type III secretion protein S [Chelatococcus caeni]